MLFADRRQAGRALARRLAPALGADEDVLVLGLPRGGVPVAYEVACGIGAPLDVFVVRKLGVPGHEELAMGAIGSGGVRVLNQDVLDELQIPEHVLHQIIQRERLELERRERAYRPDRESLRIEGRTIVVVDDGLATGASMQAALQSLRQHAPRRLVAAVPIAPADTCDALARLADEVICVETPNPFSGVGRWYEDFRQTNDEEVRALLAAAAQRSTAPPSASPSQAILVASDDVELAGSLTVPPRPIGLVLFVHGSGSSRFSRRNQHVARAFVQRGLATLLLDLLTEDEERVDAETHHLRFDIPLLAWRVTGAVGWLGRHRTLGGLPLGLFGASTGAAAALFAAAECPNAVRALVSRGGRTDLAGRAILRVRAPCLFVVGSEDTEIRKLNQQAAARMKPPPDIALVPGATHLFEEPGALDGVAEVASAFFERHLRQDTVERTRGATHA